MRSLIITEERYPNYAQPGLGAESGEFYIPATTHFIATIEDLTDMLDYGSEDIDGVDDDAGGEEEPLPTGHWTTTLSYDIYMMDTPKEGNGDGTAEDDPSKKQPKRQRQRRRSKSRQGKSGDTGTGDNSNPDSAENISNPLQHDLE